jgi:hypothetical protein
MATLEMCRARFSSEQLRVYFESMSTLFAHNVFLLRIDVTFMVRLNQMNMKNAKS